MEKSHDFSVELVVIQLTVPSSSPLSITVQVPSRWSWSNSRVGKIYVLNIDTMITEKFRVKIANFRNVLGITMFHFDVAAFPGSSLPHVPWAYSMPVSPAINSHDSGLSDVVAI